MAAAPWRQPAHTPLQQRLWRLPRAAGSRAATSRAVEPGSWAVALPARHVLAGSRRLPAAVPPCSTCILSLPAPPAEEIRALMEYKNNIRNMSVIAHVDHGA